MPGEEGYPAYLTSRLAQFYERAGKCGVPRTGRPSRAPLTGHRSGISAGRRYLRACHAGDAAYRQGVLGTGFSLCLYRRHFPAINWLNSYSLYMRHAWLRLVHRSTFRQGLHGTTCTRRCHAGACRRRSELQEIVKLVGHGRAVARRIRHHAGRWRRSIREDFLQQNAFRGCGQLYLAMRSSIGSMMHLIFCYIRRGTAARLRARARISNALFVRCPYTSKIGQSQDPCRESDFKAGIRRESKQQIDSDGGSPHRSQCARGGVRHD